MADEEASASGAEVDPGDPGSESDRSLGDPAVTELPDRDKSDGQDDTDDDTQDVDPAGGSRNKTVTPELVWSGEDSKTQDGAQSETQQDAVNETQIDDGETQHVSLRGPRDRGRRGGPRKKKKKITSESVPTSEEDSSAEDGAQDDGPDDAPPNDNEQVAPELVWSGEDSNTEGGDQDATQDSQDHSPSSAQEAVDEADDESVESSRSSNDSDSDYDVPYPSPRRTRQQASRGGARGGRSLIPEKNVSVKQEPESEVEVGLRLGYRILQDLLNTNSTFLHYPEAKKGMIDYHDVIEKPMWFEEIQRRFDNNEYLTIVDFVKDVRLLLLNTYRYFGPDALYTKRALRIEQVFENKLGLSRLPLELKKQCSLMSTHGIKTDDTESEGTSVRRAGDFLSYLLESVKEEKEQRDKSKKDLLSKERKLNKEGKGKEICQWEVDVLLAPPAITQMKTMWEVPLIGHLLQLTVQVLCIDQIPQYEVERMFLMPQASRSLAVLMTSLLSTPVQRPKLQHLPPMPYSIWSRKLSQRVAVWYKMFQTRNHDWLKVFELCGIEKEFWNILGDWNQLEDYEFHELSFHQRVWLVKSLCDYQVHNHKTMQDALADHSLQEQNCEILGVDRHGRQYLHFPQFCWSPGLCSCVRVYRCVIPVEKPRSPDPTEEAPNILIRKGKGDFLPLWFRDRGRGRGKSDKGSAAKRRKSGAEINNRKFLSRLVYRMPNGMYIRGGKRRGSNRLSDGVSCSPRKQGNTDQTASLNPVEVSSSLGGNASDAEGKTMTTEEVIDESSRSSRRQTRSKRNVSQGFYADWSDSDSLSTASPHSTPAKKPCRKSQSLSKKVNVSESSGIKLKIKLSGKTGQDTPSKESDLSENDKSEDEEVSKCAGDSCHESVAEEEASRSEWATLALNRKSGDCGEDSDEGDEEEEKDGSSQTRKDDTDFNLADEFPWTPPEGEHITNGKQKRPHFNPEWLLMGAEHFELVADSIQGIRDLIDGLCEDDDDVGLIQRLKNSSGSTKPICEEKLEHRLQELVNETSYFELKMESNARKVRWKLFEEWEAFRNRPMDVKDEAEQHWLNIFECGLEVQGNTPEVKVKVEMEIKEEKTTDSLDGSKEIKTEKCEDAEPPSELGDDGSESGYDIRHSLRAKKPKIDNPQLKCWLNSDSEEEESDEDDEDAWEMPSRRKKKKPVVGRSRKSKKDEDEMDETGSNSKVVGDKIFDVAKNFSFEAEKDNKESSQSTDTSMQNLSTVTKPKMNQKLLPNKLTLDKEGNMFITLGCGTRVQLKKDDQGRIIVPEGHEGLSMIHGKTLDQLVGSGKVVQNKKKKKVNRPANRNSTTLFPSESQPAKRSTTLFPAISQPGGIVQAKEWTPPVVSNNMQIQGTSKPKVETSIQAKEWMPPVAKVVALTPASMAQLKTYGNRKKNQTPLTVTRVVSQPQTKKKSEPDEVVVLSDGSDDSIEVIKETEPKNKKQNGVPRIESVIGNASVDSFAPKPLTKSVTMTPVAVTLTPVFKSKNQSPSKGGKKPNQWNPVISNTVSLEPASSSTRVPPPGAPQVVITPAKNVQNRRVLQSTGVFHQPTPNQSFVPVNTIPMRQAQQQFVPMNQMMPVTNQFQPVAQVVGMNNQYIVANTAPFAPIGNSYLVNAAPSYQYVPMAQAPGPIPLPVSAFDLGLPPGLRGQIVLANGDNNQFSYALKLDDGGLIFLSNDQVSKIRAANGGKLTTMIQMQTH